MDTVLNTDLKVKRRDKPPLNPIAINRLSTYNSLRIDFQRSNKITEPRFTLLIHLANHYKTTGFGLTVFAMAKYISPNDRGRKEVTNTQYKINRLLLGGLIEIAGHGRYNSHLYIPTQRVLKELQEMCDKINEG